MRAELETGEIIDLKKDCDCLTHDGPHWLHMSDLSKKLNYQNHRWALEAKPPKDIQQVYHLENALRHYAHCEALRLGELAHDMEQRKIVRLIRE